MAATVMALRPLVAMIAVAISRVTTVVGVGHLTRSLAVVIIIMAAIVVLAVMIVTSSFMTDIFGVAVTMMLVVSQYWVGG